MTFAARLARERPDEIAVRDDNVAWSWGEIDRRLRRATSTLQRLDLGGRRRVAIVARNSADTALAYAACTLAGASAVAVNSHLTAPEIAYIIDDSEARAVLCDGSTSAAAREAARQNGIETVLTWGADVGDAESLWSGEDVEPSTNVEPRRTLVYTSGTTGRPKGVELPMTSWVGGSNIEEHLAGLAQNSMVAHGRHLVVGPLYHSGPLTGTRLLLGGAPLTVLNKFDAEKVLTEIDRDQIGSTIMVPTHFQRILALPEERRAAFDGSSLRFVLQVGAKCPTPVKRAMIDWWGDVVWESYGASEVGTTCMISAAEWLERPGSVGRAVPPFEAYIRDPLGGGRAPAGTEGELWFRDTAGHGIEYISGARSGSDFTLGEIARMDEQGYVWITDRASDMVVSGGVNIYPAEVEQVLIRHPQIDDVACFGVPDDEMGEQLVAMIVPTDPAAPPRPEDVESFARQGLAGYKIPRRLIVADLLPRTPVGKLDKRTMRRVADTRSEPDQRQKATM